MQAEVPTRKPVICTLTALCTLCMLDSCSSAGTAGSGGNAGGSSGDSFGTCTPRASVACMCSDGSMSTAMCLDDGSGKGPCACSAEAGATSEQDMDAAPSDAGVPSTSPIGSHEAGARLADGAADVMAPGTSGMGSIDGATSAPRPSSGCGMSNVPASGNQTLNVGGTQRTLIVNVPSNYDPKHPYRLIFAWHGLGGNAMQIAQLDYYGLGSRSAGSAILIAGDGQAGTGQQAGFTTWPNTNDSDIAFTRQMLDWAKTSYCIDSSRVFSVGMSAGGLMSNVVACELGDSFRAMVAMSGGGPQGYALTPCKGELAVWISHGTADDNVPFSYGQMSRDYWTKANHCGTSTVAVMPGTCQEYQGCDPGYPVQFCPFDGGHMVPDFAPDATWNFFSRF